MRRFMRLCLVLMVALCGVLTLGCGRLGRPALRASYVNSVPLPNGLYEDAWRKMPVTRVRVRRAAGSFNDRRTVILQAIHDGRALSILARWADTQGTPPPRQWAWDPSAGRYELTRNPVDQFALLWPLTPGAATQALDDGPAATWDVWRWRAGWAKEVRFAEDMRLHVEPHPLGTSPESVDGTLYPASNGQGLVEVEWRMDSGAPGLRATPRPRHFMGAFVPAEVAANAQGSAADVLATGVYYPKFLNTKKGKHVWRFTERGNFWFLEFYRLLRPTGKSDEDYDLSTGGSFTFRVALWDNTLENDFYLSDPVRLVIAPTPAVAK